MQDCARVCMSVCNRCVGRHGVTVKSLLCDRDVTLWRCDWCDDLTWENW